MDYIKVEEALASVKTDLNEAWRNLRALERGNPQVDDWYFTIPMSQAIERAFTTLLLLSEALELPQFHKIILKEYKKAECRKNGFDAYDNDPDGGLHLTASPQIENLLGAFQAVTGLREKRITRKNIDLIEVLKNCQYSLTLPLSCGAPENETQLHERIEAILKCIYPDLKTKPTISKPIKYFIPDTGIPSIKTLIEYKYAASQEAVTRVSEEILVDTQGYVSSEWQNFIYLIYETKRFMPEKKWKQHLLECGNPRNTQVIVICGETPKKTVKKKPQKKREKSKK